MAARTMPTALADGAPNNKKCSQLWHFKGETSASQLWHLKGVMSVPQLWHFKGET